MIVNRQFRLRATKDDAGLIRGRVIAADSFELFLAFRRRACDRSNLVH